MTMVLDHAVRIGHPVSALVSVGKHKAYAHAHAFGSPPGVHSKLGRSLTDINALVKRCIMADRPQAQCSSISHALHAKFHGNRWTGLLGCCSSHESAFGHVTHKRRTVLRAVLHHGKRPHICQGTGPTTVKRTLHCRQKPGNAG